MQNLNSLDRYRDTQPKVIAHYGGAGDSTCGVFSLPGLDGGPSLRVVASSGRGWDHISVSTEERCPTWQEMSYIVKLFFRPHETVMQLHVPTSQHINVHPYCLHCWRPRSKKLPVPPSWMVG